MKEMTNNEADYWDEYFTQNTIMPDLSKPGYFSRKYGMSLKLDPETTCILVNYAEALHKPPAEIIAELIRENFAS